MMQSRVATQRKHMIQCRRSGRGRPEPCYQAPKGSAQLRWRSWPGGIPRL